jgi:hypothetical protein
LLFFLFFNAGISVLNILNTGVDTLKNMTKKMLIFAKLGIWHPSIWFLSGFQALINESLVRISGLKPVQPMVLGKINKNPSPGPTRPIVVGLLIPSKEFL